MARHSGRGPSSSLKRPRIPIYTRVYVHGVGSPG